MHWGSDRREHSCELCLAKRRHGTRERRRGMELGQRRASCSRWMRINLNSAGTWDPSETFGPEGVGAELALGNRGARCRGGWAGKSRVQRTGWESEISVDPAAFPFLEPHTGLGRCPGEEMQGRAEEPHAALAASRGQSPWWQGSHSRVTGGRRSGGSIGVSIAQLP